jgi:threonine dehydratase
VPDLAVTFADVTQAAARIAGAVVRTPTLHSQTLSAICGAEIWCKFENLQFTASFKERGALNRLLQLDPAERIRGVVAMSAGNHAQGLAYHATRLGIPSTIVMPSLTPNLKVRNTETLGARVILHGDGFADAATRARQLADAEGLVWVPPYDDPAIIAGQGTVALELLADAPELDTIVVPVGGGGLMGGIAVVARHQRPEISLIGVQSDSYPSMQAALSGDSAPIGGITIAEGIAVPTAGELTLPIFQALVDDVVTVSESRIEEAINLLLEIEKTVVEGAGSAGLAAVLDDPQRFAGRRVGLILCGGNIDSRLLAQVIMRGLVRAGRLVRVSIDIADSPGALALVATTIAHRGGNIVEVNHQRWFTALAAKSAVLELVFEARDSTHGSTIVQALRDNGFHVEPGVH